MCFFFVPTRPRQTRVRKKGVKLFSVCSHIQKSTDTEIFSNWIRAKNTEHENKKMQQTKQKSNAKFQRQKSVSCKILKNRSRDRKITRKKNYEQSHAAMAYWFWYWKFVIRMTLNAEWIEKEKTEMRFCFFLRSEWKEEQSNRENVMIEQQKKTSEKAE